MVKKSAEKDTKGTKEKVKKPATKKKLAAKAKASAAASIEKKKPVAKTPAVVPAAKKRVVHPKTAIKNDNVIAKEAEAAVAVSVKPKPISKPEIKKEEKAYVKTEISAAPPQAQKPEALKVAEKSQEIKAGPSSVKETVVEKTAAVVPEVREAKVLEFDLPIPLKDFAVKLGVKPNEIILDLMGKNIFATINQSLGEELVVNLLKARGIEFRKPPKIEEQVSKEHTEMESKQDVRHITARPPVVTFMGHVDHGKTSLLDFIRKTRVADKEKGGITQHIGAYEVRLKNGSVTFLDTPGHEAFTAMRARGANATDIVVLVVAADDGVMPQTKEALDHARAASVTIVVALNKCDLPSANIDKVKGQLSQIGLSPEDWGGKTIVLPVSAKTGEGVDELLEMLLLEAELLELKANPELRARGVVIEGKLSSAQGPVATVLVKNGTLRLGDMILTGMHYGRVKAMMDHTGTRVKAAPPSKPVTILGLSGVPMAGDEFFVVRDEKKARILSTLKQDEARSHKLKMSHRVTLEDFYSKMKEGVAKELDILLKGDVQGSVEALKASLLELNTKDVKVTIIHADVGNVTESDVMLAVASNAIIMGFNVKIDEGAADLAVKEDIEIKSYNIIYEAIEDVRAAMEGLLAPVEKEIFVGRAIVKQPFRVTKVGTIAGSQVVRGKIVRAGIAKLIRDKQVVYEGKISSLKRFKDDVREVNEGVECGIGLSGHDDIRTGDLIEIYQIEKIARRLDARR
ncbi:MAG: translation initiation factor IF-2 [Candidatus Omnitrophica bacterium]|nr:translation initiation factor IF-2 [Candidatus Omnitrophota bacterium]